MYTNCLRSQSGVSYSNNKLFQFAGVCMTHLSSQVSTQPIWPVSVCRCLFLTVSAARCLQSIWPVSAGVSHSMTCLSCQVSTQSVWTFSAGVSHSMTCLSSQVSTQPVWPVSVCRCLYMTCLSSQVSTLSIWPVSAGVSHSMTCLSRRSVWTVSVCRCLYMTCFGSQVSTQWVCLTCLCRCFTQYDLSQQPDVYTVSMNCLCLQVFYRQYNLSLFAGVFQSVWPVCACVSHSMTCLSSQMSTQSVWTVTVCRCFTVIMTCLCLQVVFYSQYDLSLFANVSHSQHDLYLFSGVSHSQSPAPERSAGVSVYYRLRSCVLRLSRRQVPYPSGLAAACRGGAAGAGDQRDHGGRLSGSAGPVPPPAGPVPGLPVPCAFHVSGCLGQVWPDLCLAGCGDGSGWHDDESGFGGLLDRGSRGTSRLHSIHGRWNNSAGHVLRGARDGIPSLGSPHHGVRHRAGAGVCTGDRAEEESCWGLAGK